MIHGKIILFDYHKETKNGFPIKIMLTDGVRKQTRYINLKLYSSRKDWDRHKVEVKRSHPDYYDVYDEVNTYKNKLNQALKEGRRSSIDKVIMLIEGNNSDEFFDYFKTYIESQKGISSKKTIEGKEQAVNNFKGFISRIKLVDIDKSLIRSYVLHCKKKDISNNSIITYLTRLKTIYNTTVDKELINDRRPFKGVMPKKEKTKDKSIEASELKLIKEAIIETRKESSGGGLNDFRNYFLSMFYLGGLDFIDIANWTCNKKVDN